MAYRESLTPDDLCHTPDRLCWDGRHPDDPAYDLEVVDAETGKPIRGEAIWQADQKEGWYDHFVRNEHGKYKLNEAKDELVTERVHRAIRIVPKVANA